MRALRRNCAMRSASQLSPRRSSPRDRRVRHRVPAHRRRRPALPALCVPLCHAGIDGLKVRVAAHLRRGTSARSEDNNKVRRMIVFLWLRCYRCRSRQLRASAWMPRTRSAGDSTRARPDSGQRHDVRAVYAMALRAGPANAAPAAQESSARNAEGDQRSAAGQCRRQWA